MSRLIFITHPEVKVDAAIPVTDWALSETGCRRAAGFARSDVVANVTNIWASAERKAQQTADFIAQRAGVPVQTNEHLGENDRSATGFLPPPEFEAAADSFFAQPDVSFRGWETARAAQGRIENAVRGIAAHHGTGDLAIVAHGAVGTLLYCAFKGLPISRAYDQPSQGHYWSAELSDLQPQHHWKPI
ncbi:histidine phosphatase family protein [Roseobacter denitrificans]|uniref:Phosphoglycerate mutase, putative n=1 Tax=Roseobacter denitrificans (strain ATCC 33942 / OCh 114) TaxID=375451 RepID=Q16BB9_ROSDO|nr:histidine phosphatase family protein [Roseobacter denitrificans]ABG30724.1 phosphoglycerate mutase, putative [Roseobacter denitrificans OCh 114]AVL53841.1 histidine phosphatase family protein [Roseobacter denitrificans]SFG17837.1 Broad specificity phosphatase PhoE [Roseobacter denitrificans OCh 114]